MIGHPCFAHVALGLRGFPEDTMRARTSRIFGIGHHIEASLISEIQAKLPGFGNVELHAHGPDGKQFGWHRLNGHMRGHTDGIFVVNGARHALLELKSMGAPYFREFRKVGLRLSHPHYFDQVQLMMGMSGIPLTYVVAENKDDSNVEVSAIQEDPLIYWHLYAKAEQVLEGAGQRIAKEKTNFRCTMCGVSEACWDGAVMYPKCSTCLHAKPLYAGDEDHRKWWCVRHGKSASKTCPDHQPWKTTPK